MSRAPFHRHRYLFVHGWGHDASDFTPLIAALGDDAECFAIDLPGHGSRVDDEGPFEIGRFAVEVADWIEHEVTATSPLVLVGWSMGALVAIAALDEAARRGAQRPAGLVTIAGTACFLERAGYDGGQDGKTLFTLRQWLSRDPERAMERFRAWMESPEPPSAGHRKNWRALDQTLGLLAKVDLRKQVASCNLPALCIHGERDRVVPPAATAFLCGELPRATSLIMPAGHAPHLSHPGECAKAMQRFADSLERAST